MSASLPYAELIGTATIYIAAASTAMPAINATPGSDWVELGPTEGDQTVATKGKLTFFRDNSHTGPRSARRDEEDVMVKFAVVGITYEHLARVLHAVSNVVTTTSGGVNVKEVGFERGQVPTEYAILIKGSTASPYGVYPAQNYIPRCVQDSEPELVRGKTTRAKLDCEFVALVDDTQTSGKKLGWSVAQIS